MEVRCSKRPRKRHRRKIKSKRSTIIKNRPKYLLQWGILAALILFICGLIPSEKAADPEAYCPMGGLQALATYLVNNSLPYSSGDWGRWGFGDNGRNMYVNFLTDNDITGGNSGSPVLNSKGELIGLAFDGNKESLAGDVWYTPGYNKCVCVDIRFILWTLDRYAGMTRIIDELEFNR